MIPDDVGESEAAGGGAHRRPRVICHMMASVDGRIVSDGWPELGKGWSEYERTGATFEADAWMCGRITMEHFAAGVRDAREVARESARALPDAARSDFVAPGAHAPYAVALDPSGRLLWETNEIGGDHVVALLADHVSDDYLALLRERGVSYLLVGARAGKGADLDLAAALDKLVTVFGVRTLLLEGGGRINGAMLRDGLIDEVSLLLAPVADGAVGTPSLFDAHDRGAGRGARRLVLESVERRADDVLWLRYRVAAGPGTG
jgi:2,5-diamino-6-(ribosylamino)-4(3H)-pyrimidinone 5'-phosphate reductase